VLAADEEVAVRIAAGIATALALVCAAGLAIGVAGASAASESRDMVVVSSMADVVNGDVSSLSALRARPGRDGISLREALQAADRTGGSAMVYILFSARLNGRTIEVRSELPPIYRDHVVLEGVAPNGSPARVTLDGRRAPRGKLFELLLVQASEVTVRWLRFTGVYPRPPFVHEPAVAVRPGWRHGVGPALGPRRIANVQIVDDVFDNRGITFPVTVGPIPDGLLVGNYPGPNSPDVASAHVSGITIARNTFLHYVGDGDAVGVWAEAAGATVQGVVVQDNTFDQNEIPIELVDRYNAPRLAGTRIVGNTITGGGGAITLDGNATNGTIDGTLIEDNVISDNQYDTINIDAASFGQGMPDIPRNDVISNMQIVNNVVRADISAKQAGIYIEAGNITSTPPSRVSAVTIESDTLVDDLQWRALFDAVPNGPGASGNMISDVTIRNSILYNSSGTTPLPTGGPVPSQSPDVLTNSLISGPGWAGSNGNITGNPDFVDEAARDYQLAAGSPAINAGAPIGAPTYDLDGARRDAQPDIGAFEYGARPRPLLTVIAEQLGGGGTVTSRPSGINCGTACSARFDPNTTVTLTAKPDTGSRFLGWQHGCSRKARCTIRLSSAQSVTARFAP
jgi:hypothetical protein